MKQLEDTKTIDYIDAETPKKSRPGRPKQAKKLTDAQKTATYRARQKAKIDALKEAVPRRPLSEKLQPAIEVLDDLANGRKPNKSSAIAAALSLEFLGGEYTEIFWGMRCVAIDGNIDLDAIGREKCRVHAEILRKKITV